MAMAEQGGTNEDCLPNTFLTQTMAEAEHPVQLMRVNANGPDGAEIVQILDDLTYDVSENARRRVRGRSPRSLLGGEGEYIRNAALGVIRELTDPAPYNRENGTPITSVALQEIPNPRPNPFAAERYGSSAHQRDYYPLTFVSPDHPIVQQRLGQIESMLGITGPAVETTSRHMRRSVSPTNLGLDLVRIHDTRSNIVTLHVRRPAPATA